MTSLVSIKPRARPAGTQAEETRAGPVLKSFHTFADGGSVNHQQNCLLPGPCPLETKHKPTNDVLNMECLSPAMYCTEQPGVQDRTLTLVDFWEPLTGREVSCFTRMYKLSWSRQRAGDPPVAQHGWNAHYHAPGGTWSKASWPAVSCSREGVYCAPLMA